jgi:hypothetical protein
MAAFVPVPSVIKCRFILKSALYQAGFGMTWSYGSAGAPAAGTLQSLAGVMAGAWQSDLASVTTSKLSLNSVTLQDIASDRGNSGVANVNYAGTSPSTGNAPASLCALIVHTVPRHYRGGKFRTYLPGPTEEDLQDSKNWTATYQGNVQAGWGQFINAIISGSAPILQLNHVGVSYKQGHIPNPLPKTWGPINVPAPRTDGPLVLGIVSHFVPLTPGSQKRRLRPG